MAPVPVVFITARRAPEAAVMISAWEQRPKERVEGDDTLRVDAATEGGVAPIAADVPIETRPEPPNRIDEPPPEVPS